METASYSIGEFCSAHRISRAHYYELRKQGLAPDEIRTEGDRGCKKITAGRPRVTISKEAAARWRERMETLSREREKAF